MLRGLAWFVFGFSANVWAFFALRYAVARALGVRGGLVVFGLEHRPWATVSLARRALFALAGPFGGYLSAVVFVFVGLLLAGDQAVDEVSMRVLVGHGGPAYEAGVIDGDRVLSVDGVRVLDWPALKSAVAHHPGGPLDLAVERDGRELHLHPTPGPTHKIQVGPQVARVDRGTLGSLGVALAAPLEVWARFFRGLTSVVSGSEPAEVVGPIGIVKAVPTGTPSVGVELEFVGKLNAYFLWIPSVLALVFFPRKRTGSPSA